MRVIPQVVGFTKEACTHLHRVSARRELANAEFPSQRIVGRTKEFGIQIQSWSKIFEDYMDDLNSTAIKIWRNIAAYEQGLRVPGKENVVQHSMLRRQRPFDKDEHAHIETHAAS
jgi:hypothetical protein